MVAIVWNLWYDDKIRWENKFHVKITTWVNAEDEKHLRADCTITIVEIDGFLTMYSKKHRLRFLAFIRTSASDWFDIFVVTYLSSFLYPYVCFLPSYFLIPYFLLPSLFSSNICSYSPTGTPPPLLLIYSSRTPHISPH